MPDLAELYLADLRERFTKLRDTAERAVAQTSDAHLVAAPDAETNSIAVTLKHVGGNLRSRFTDFLTTDGEKPGRDRDAEFVIGPADTRESLLAGWAAGWDLLLGTVDRLRADDLVRTVHIRGEPHSVVGALDRSLVHLAYHVGQIVQLAKHHAGPSWRTLTIPRAAPRGDHQEPQPRH
jgi:hypothetical protein